MQKDNDVHRVVEKFFEEKNLENKKGAVFIMEREREKT